MHQALEPSIAAHAAYMAGIVERLREVAQSILQTAEERHDAETSSRVNGIVRAIDQERCAIESLQPAPAVAPKPDPAAANTEPHDEVEEASMESFPASDPPASRNHEH
ncbi:MAG: hypothetical protein QM783_07155 [Phycisphaerales bacterium]